MSAPVEQGPSAETYTAAEISQRSALSRRRLSPAFKAPSCLPAPCMILASSRARSPGCAIERGSRDAPPSSKPLSRRKDRVLVHFPPMVSGASPNGHHALTSLNVAGCDGERFRARTPVSDWTTTLSNHGTEMRRKPLGSWADVAPLPPRVDAPITAPDRTHIPVIHRKRPALRVDLARADIALRRVICRRD